MKSIKWRRISEVLAGSALASLAIGGAAALYVLIYLGGQYAAVMAEDEVFWSIARIVRRIGYLGALAAIAYVGIALLEGRQVCVLYLRRFRLNVTTISPTHAGGLGRRVRLFTLHDGEFVPSEVPVIDRWLTRLGPVLALALLVIAGKVMADAMLTGVSEGNDGNWIAMVYFIAFSCGTLWLLLAMLLLYRFRLRRGATVHVRKPEDIDKAAAAMRWASYWLFRPAIGARQATVVAVSTELWQPTVRALVGQSHAVVVDVSEETENLAWELNALAEDGVNPTLIAAEGSRTGPWTEWPALLRDRAHPPLLYKLGDQGALKSFRRQLRLTLFRTAVWTRHRPLAWPVHVRRLAEGSAFFALALAVSAGSAWAIGVLAFYPALSLVGN